jgi:hypothetical protein
LTKKPFGFDSILSSSSSSPFALLLSFSKFMLFGGLSFFEHLFVWFCWL